MAHLAQKNFCKDVKRKFPNKFKDARVLDVGSLDINGNNRFLFDGDYSYTGIDLGEGKNVDVVCRGHLYKSDEKFDVIVSSECFEHDEFYRETLLNIYSLLKDGGLFLFTCATTGRPEHGTTRTSPADAPFVGDYYKNLEEKDIREVLDVEELFSNFEFRVNKTPQDLYFWGIKKVSEKEESVEEIQEEIQEEVITENEEQNVVIDDE